MTVFGEVSASGDQLVLVAGGPGTAVLAAAKACKRLTPAFTKSDPPGALVVPLTWPLIVQLSNEFGPDWTAGPRLQQWIAGQAEARTEHVGTDLPEWLRAAIPSALTPRPYQVEGAHEIARTGRALIFDEPRTGKTITTILGLALAAGVHHDLGRPIVVVCPASVVDPWVETFNAWAPWWTAVAWRGAPVKRHALAGTADVYVTSYDTARVDAAKTAKSPLLDLGPASVVVDECHYIKNQATHRSRAVRRLAAAAAKRGGAFVALSGTPITHHPGDLWPTLNCLEPDAYPARTRWVPRYCETLVTDYGEQIGPLRRDHEPEFRTSLLGQHRRVARADVMSQLPPKTYSVRTVELPAKWRKAYDEMEATMLAELPDGEQISVMGVLAQLTRLSQLASAPADVEVTETLDEATGELRPHTEVTLKGPSWKVDALLEVLDERCEAGFTGTDGEGVVAFAPSRQLMMLAGQAAAAAGYRVGYIVGGQAAADRTATIKAFQAGALDLVCATTGAGGTGITLSRAGTLVFLQRPWALAESLQAEDRAEGDMDATRGTEVIDVVAKGTIDDRVRSVLRERAGQLSDLVQDPRIVTELLGGAAALKEAS